MYSISRLQFKIRKFLLGRTEAALEEARKIGETGVTGSFEKEFQEIEKTLDSIPLNFSDGEVEIEKLVDLIR